ncbi:MAG TPA: SDR family NAD(P)-dependent oxidoreductase [Candidatus Binatia bacterium]|nr:SDR family NAD(P)-dependent oxidoreductase [Candidatus Binatia bacterium]
MKGRVALVTGGGRGIGRAIALEFGREGAKVAVSSRTRSELDAVVKELRGLGSDGLAVECDVMDRSAIKKMVATVIERLGRLDILVNNAGGVWGKVEDMLTLTHDDKTFEDHLFFNLTSAYYATRVALPQMVKQNFGRVMFIGSGYARRGGGTIAYSAAKHGLIGMMRAMVYQVPPAITVNMLCPAWTNTKLANDFFQQGAKELGTTAQALRAQAESENVQKRMLEPEELGPMAALIASERGGKGITGQVLCVDGGDRV